METKTCTSCGEDKDVGQFYVRKGKPRPSCKACQKEYEREYRERTGYSRNWEHHLKSKYGITGQDYHDMAAAQNHVCAVCNRPETITYANKTRRLAVDHDHRTGKVRGLLCAKCNVMLGYARENSDYLASAMMYLREHDSCRSQRV
jgi:hypothetical protein